MFSSSLPFLVNGDCTRPPRPSLVSGTFQDAQGSARSSLAAQIHCSARIRSKTSTGRRAGLTCRETGHQLPAPAQRSHGAREPPAMSCVSVRRTLPAQRPRAQGSRCWSRRHPRPLCSPAPGPREESGACQQRAPWATVSPAVASPPRPQSPVPAKGQPR